MYDKHSRKALTIAERFADAAVSEAKLRFAWGDARRAAQVAYRQKQETAEALAMWAVSMLCEADISKVLGAVEGAAQCEAFPFDQTRYAKKHQVNLLWDICGNLFHPCALDSFWRMPSVLKLAQEIYENLAFDRLPALADALEEAGCRDADILSHLRGPGPHVRNCWTVDLVLGKE